MNTATFPAAPEAVSNRPERRRSPWGAALLSLVVPGLGHVYIGRALRGLVLALAGMAVGVAALALSMVGPHPAFRLLLLGALVLPLLLIPVDAFRLAGRVRARYTPKRYNRWYVYVGIWAAAAFVIQPLISEAIRGRVARAFTLRSNSMEPSLLPGDYVLAAPIAEGGVRHAMPVVYRGTDGGDYIQRVVGLPGDTLEMRNKTLHVNGRAQREPYVRHIDPATDPADPRMLWQREHLTGPRPGYEPSRDQWGPLVVPAGHHFLMGDNRDNSLDSRYLGFVSRDRIHRRPAWIYLSRDREQGRIRWDRLGQGIR